MRLFIRYAVTGCVLILFWLPTRVEAGAWTLPRGQLWLKTALFYQATSEQFCSGNLAFCDRHQRAPFDPFVGGRSKSLAVFTEAVYGLTGWLDIGIQVPYYSLEFRDQANPVRPVTRKIGDIRFYAKYRFLTNPVVASIRIGAKSPTGGVNVNSEVVPVGEGQWDFEFYGDVGRSFRAFPGYVNLNVGYRQRTVNQRFNFKPGDEVMFLAEGGWSVTPRVMVRGLVDYLYSAHPRSLGFTFTGQRRELLTVAPSLMITPTRTLTFEGMVRLPLRGQDVPAGPQFSFGVSYTLDLAGLRSR